MSLDFRLVLGDLDLCAAPYGLEFGSDFGAPDNVTTALAYLLEDGEIEVSERASNRTITFGVIVEGNDLLDLANAEAALARECDKRRNTLTINSGDDIAPATVFDTFRAQLTLNRDDDEEIATVRRYSVSLRAAPFARSANEVVTEATESSGSTTAAVDDGSSLAGWTGIGAAQSGGDVVSSATVTALVTAPPPSTLRLVRTGAISMGSTPYLEVDWKAEVSAGAASAPGGLGLLVDGVTAPLVAETASPTSGYTRTVFLVTDPSVSVLTFDIKVATSVAGTTTRSFKITSIDRTSVAPYSGTSRQKIRSLDVAGSARTQSALEISHETSALDSTLVYTWPDDGCGYAPPLRSWRSSSGSTTTDATLVSGSWNMLDTAIVYDVPISRLPEGVYVLYARLRSDTAAALSLTWSAVTRVGSSSVGPTLGGTRSHTFEATASWRFVPIGRMVLPPLKVGAGSQGVVRVSLVAASPGAADIDIDETWLFNTSIGALTRVECGSGTPTTGGASNRLWIKAASTDDPSPTVLRGTAVDESDAFYAFDPTGDRQAWGVHTFTPPGMKVFTVTAGATDAAVTLRHYPRWHTHAGS